MKPMLQGPSLAQVPSKALKSILMNHAKDVLQKNDISKPLSYEDAIKENCSQKKHVKGIIEECQTVN
jgi:hypothetical protein